MTPPRTAIIGAGPAGLTAAYLLGKRGAEAVVLEADPRHVGGIARTEELDGFRFDIGGHRFFSKSKEVEELWTEILGPEMLVRPRSSRIYYDGKFFSYPLQGLEALRKLGPVEAARCLASYAKAKAFPVADPQNVEGWVVNQFGRRLYEIFFKTYTEKVWGMPCAEISADFAAQRIKGLSFTSAVKNALFPQKPKERGEVIKTLIDTFRYPRLGPGQLWEACAAKVREMGGEVRMGARVTGCRFEPARKVWRVSFARADGSTGEVEADHVISSAPLREVVGFVSPALSDEARAAAGALRYRDFLSVVLMRQGPDLFTDNWIYIHDPGVQVGRIQNFKQWSPDLVPEPSWSCYGLEYFCFEGDGLWSAPDEQLVDLARREMERIGLCPAREISRGHVVRQPKAYPVYDQGYQQNVACVAQELARKLPTLHVVGRNGMHKYNNQDHSMMTAMLSVENILAGEKRYDVWRVNQDAEYHEAGEAGQVSGASGLRLVPGRAA